MKPSAPESTAEQLLETHDIKPTPNRLLVVREILRATAPVSLVELETSLGSLERSSILRVLNLLLEKDIVHAFEDGRGVSKYEICHGETHCSIDDMHAHFYCERCNRTFCFEDISAPQIRIPSGFRIRSVNYMLKGLCPECSKSD
ncbi:MAG: transcriptional repressor [Muribaculaceae bacterium]|nr:transcriptional repressor [Muribaculaceae bacterium]